MENLKLIPTYRLLTLPNGGGTAYGRMKSSREMTENSFLRRVFQKFWRSFEKCGISPPNSLLKPGQLASKINKIDALWLDRLCENDAYMCRGQVANINTKISVFVDSSSTRDGLK
jgi:hypothetical protein